MAIKSIKEVIAAFDNMDSVMAKKLDTIFGKFVLDIFNNIVFRSPVDVGFYRADWDFGRSPTQSGVISAYQIGNSMPYAEIFEVGSQVGKKPWPTAGPKTVEKSGRVWSSQMSQPVSGGAVESAPWDDLEEILVKTVLGEL